MDFERFKTVNVISKETFEQIVPGSEKVENQEVPPPPPPVHYSGNLKLKSVRVINITHLFQILACSKQ